MIRFLLLLLASLLYITIFTPAHAYAGPGVAFGAIIVFITIILAFFASTLLGLFNFLKVSIKKILSFVQSNNEKRKIKKRKFKR